MPTSEQDACRNKATCKKLQLTIEDKAVFIDDTKKFRTYYEKFLKIQPSENTSFRNACESFWGSASKSRNEMKELLKNIQSVVVIQTIIDIDYEARYNIESRKELTDEFLGSFCNLPQSYSLESKNVFFDFFYEWGTHIITKVRLGRKRIRVEVFSQKKYFYILQKKFAELLKFDLYENRTMISISSNSTVPSSYNIANNLLYFNSKTESYKPFGGHQNIPYPVFYELVEIPYFISYNNLGNVPECQALNSETLLKMKESIYVAMTSYLTNIGETDTTVTRTMTLSWPTGQYSLLKPKNGCPRNWNVGHRFEDMENSYYFNKTSPDLLRIADSMIDNDIELTFCTKTIEAKFNETFEWGVGAYCIFQYNICFPFESAQMFINDEDTNNKNSISGVLPFGMFGKDTKYEFCCRNDGPTSYPLFLPVDQPFFLVPVADSCQMVYGMKTKVHWITWDSENDESSLISHVGGRIHPRYESLGTKNSPDIKLFFCYYYT